MCVSKPTKANQSSTSVSHAEVETKGFPNLATSMLKSCGAGHDK